MGNDNSTSDNSIKNKAFAESGVTHEYARAFRFIIGENMATFRINKTKDYTVLSNHHLRNKKMSLKAKGLLSLMLSLPEDWDYSAKGLTEFSKDGRDGVKVALVELEQLGYLTRTQAKDESGQFAGYVYNVYEKPLTEKPLTEKPLTEKPSTANKQQNTKQQNTNIYKYIIDLLNSACATNYRATSKTTQKYIRARLNEGYSVDDFKTVISKKAKEWKGTEMEQYLRPETLFGTKFESYLNAKINKKEEAQAAIGGQKIERRDYDADQMQRLFTNLDNE